MTKVVFTGITGLLGRYFLNQKPTGWEIVGTYNKNTPLGTDNSYMLDITDRNAVLSFINKVKPKVVVHAASIGSVDYCETHKEEAHKTNVEGTQNIIDACKETGAKIIFTSSNAVYDGTNPPYNEESIINPLDVYGKTKAEGEELIKKSGIQYVILRLMTMYGWSQEGGRSNPVTWVINELKEGNKIKVVDDIYNNHLYAGQAADIIWKIVIKENYGLYNIAGKDCVSRYELALKVCNIFDLDPSLVEPVKNDFFKNIAPRPKNTCFNIKQIEEDLKVEPLGISEGLKRMRDEK